MTLRNMLVKTLLITTLGLSSGAWALQLSQWPVFLPEGYKGKATWTHFAKKNSLNNVNDSRNRWIFGAAFDTRTWSGRSYVYDIYDRKFLWNSSIPPASERFIVTAFRNVAGDYEGKSGAFTWENIQHYPSMASQIGDASIVLWARGDRLQEQQQGGQLRNRETVLGDIVHSSPSSREPPRCYRCDPSLSLVGGMVYVGANDGMVHGFEMSNGVEKIAYVPSTVYADIKAYAEPNYGDSTHPHLYSVDGQLTIAEVNGRKILVGSTGAGRTQPYPSSTLFALDVTDPVTRFTPGHEEEIVLWETDAGQLPSLGYMLGKIEVGQLTNGRWVAIVGNGYLDDSPGAIAPLHKGKAALLVLDLMTGKLIKELVVNQTQGNGLSPAGVLREGEKIVAAYAGDLRGNLWAFYLNDVSEEKWTSRHFYQTVPRQPIVQQPYVRGAPRSDKISISGAMVVFSTGKLLELSDRENHGLKSSVYGLLDDPVDRGTTFVGRDPLQQQSILTQDDGIDNVSKNSINWAIKRGWYLDPPEDTSFMTVDVAENASSVYSPNTDQAIFTSIITQLPSLGSKGKSRSLKNSVMHGGDFGALAVDVDTLPYIYQASWVSDAIVSIYPFDDIRGCLTSSYVTYDDDAPDLPYAWCWKSLGGTFQGYVNLPPPILQPIPNPGPPPDPDPDPPPGQGGPHVTRTWRILKASHSASSSQARVGKHRLVKRKSTHRGHQKISPNLLHRGTRPSRAHPTNIGQTATM